MASHVRFAKSFQLGCPPPYGGIPFSDCAGARAEQISKRNKTVHAAQATFLRFVFALMHKISTRMTKLSRAAPEMLET